MTYRTFFHHIIILGFMVLVGYCIANAIRSESFMGLLLALTSLGAGIYFIRLLSEARNVVSKNETEETS